MTPQTRVPGPAVAANRLRTRLLRYPESANLTQAKVAKSLDWSESKLHRIENGPGRIQTTDLRAMLDLYGVTDAAERENMVDLVRASRNPGISTRYKGYLSPTFQEYLDHEAFADHVYNYETKLIPGPIQLGGYADAIVSALLEDDDPDRTAAIVDARNERAEFLTGGNGPSADFIIDETALHRAIGGETTRWDLKYEAMKRVVKHLKSLNTRYLKAANQPIDAGQNADISIQVVPLEWGAYRALRGPFVVLDFQNPDDEPLVYLEHPSGEEIIRTPEVLATYRATFEELSKSIPSASETGSILDYILQSYETRLATSPLNPDKVRHGTTV